MEYDFTDDFITYKLFGQNWATHPGWNEIIKNYKPQCILEIGSWEGRSAIYWATQPSTKLVYCIDYWLDTNVEHRFDYNTQNLSNIIKIKDTSILALSSLQKEFSNYFDLIYIDGAHDSCTTLTDAVLAFNLCCEGGIIIFDDYLLVSSIKNKSNIEERKFGLKNHPKPAIDAFTNIFEDKIDILWINYEVVIQKK